MRMPMLHKSVPVKLDTVSEKQNNKFQSTRFMKKVRIICSDPYATDSSEDEGISRKHGKQFICEVLLPSSSYGVPIASVIDGSVQHSHNGEKKSQWKRVLAFRGKKQSLASRNFRGVRQRKWGKWAAEIRDPVKQKRIWLGTYESAEEASMAYETKRIEFDALTYSIGGGEEKISCSLELSKCAKEKQNLADVSAFENSNPSVVSDTSHVTPTSLLPELDSSTSDLGINVKEDELSRKANVVVKGFTESRAMDEDSMAPQIGKELDLQLELESIMLDGHGFTTPMNYLVNDFEDLHVCGLYNEDQPSVLPDFDLRFDFDDYNEAFSWMDEALPLMNGASPLNIACL